MTGGATNQFLTANWMARYWIIVDFSGSEDRKKESERQKGQIKCYRTVIFRPHAFYTRSNSCIYSLYFPNLFIYFLLSNSPASSS